ncbi:MULTISPECIES: CDP-alcohol phosphatidyltransferase family protein [Mycolicibacterium]|jgi:CDP-diacylglycerol--serine O-phosphatidyltransferase|uniref:CDP-diacylglycerol--serine o-phosphatidyltransferase PssA n=2 Tax=Mycolicibacterium TaxID=1866885 RepID=A0A378TCN6_9MYCO|nr:MULTISPECIES: phosphatidylcholine/phosphatidylserine synthase [Mycolicibacterium]ANW63220.1 CDP-diacylglycerol--serine O-phosphatidyltransferase [Mycobacterium sp. djl-10]MCV7181773.1 phosphatidylcholine/phosphatidylserine synthase [Mycolicibacterium murale]STZ58390.1 CDP-diacylglycerol--serine o-phosphatidyltransferase PssA [Mycolicibacterium tokaiense]BBY87093.1 putative CDP-diacylglycerol--serine O-phosphatidyltransferase [Mycolicibacterium tokaiense]GFG61646.1 putative CDP-diacylglycero
MQRREGQRPRAMRILPSATTVLAICAGLTSIKFALDGRPHIALALIGAAAVLDGIDGGIARALDAQSRMGAEIDSLADAVNFGVAPALVVYVTLLPTSPVGWIFALLYCVCIVLRLARFNALLDDDTKPAYTRQYFTGMPAPCGAVGVIGPLAALLQFGHGWWTAPWFVCLWFAANATLLVSRVPTLALKSVSMPSNAAPILLIAIAAAAASLLLFPYVLVLLIIVGYLLIIPFTVRSQRWVAARPEAWDAKPKERRKQRREIRRGKAPYRRMQRLGLRKPGG